HGPLPVGIDERHTVLLLVALDPRHEVEPAVERVDDRRVDGGHLLAKALELRVRGAHRRNLKRPDAGRAYPWLVAQTRRISPGAGLNVGTAMSCARTGRPAWSEPSPRARSPTSSLLTVRGHRGDERDQVERRVDEHAGKDTVRPLAQPAE